MTELTPKEAYNIALSFILRYSTHKQREALAPALITLDRLVNQPRTVAEMIRAEVERQTNDDYTQGDYNIISEHSHGYLDALGSILSFIDGKDEPE